MAKCTIEGLKSCFFEIDRCEIKVFHTDMESDQYFEGKVSTYFTIHPSLLIVVKLKDHLHRYKVHTSNFLVFYGLSHGTTFKKKGVAVF